jgi:surfeit locus 1 family protein
MKQRFAQADQDQHEHRDNEIFECHLKLGDYPKGQQYIVPLKLGTRTFAPQPFTSLLCIVLIGMLIALGRWQLHRAEEKRALFDAFAAGTDVTRLIELQTAKIARYQHVEAAGHYDGRRQVLIDNMVNAGRAGYFVITPFALEGGGWVLVNRGWVPLGASRAERPALAVGGDARRIRGRADSLPSPGIQMGDQATLSPPYPVVAEYPAHAELARLLGEGAWTGATEVVLLDPGEPDGYVRTWSPPGFPPLRHIGYAVQWFALALALFVLYLAANFRRSKESLA